jgi:hypothetical protein
MNDNEIASHLILLAGLMRHQANAAVVRSFVQIVPKIVVVQANGIDHFIGALRHEDKVKGRLMRHPVGTLQAFENPLGAHDRFPQVLDATTQRMLYRAPKLIGSLELDAEMSLDIVGELSSQSLRIGVSFGILDEENRWDVVPPCMLIFLLDNEATRGRGPAPAIANDGDVDVAALHCIEAGIPG